MGSGMTSDVKGALAPGMAAHLRGLTGQGPRSMRGSEARAKQTLKGGWLGEVGLDN